MATGVLRSPSALGMPVTRELVKEEPPSLARTKDIARSVLSKGEMDRLFPGVPRYVMRGSTQHLRPPAEGACLQEYLYAHGDVGAITRYTEDVWAAQQMQNGQKPTGYGLGPHAYAVLGLTSTSSIATGVIIGAAGYHQTQEAVRIGDSVAYTAGVLSVIRGFTETSAGVIFSAFRVLSLIPSLPLAAVGAVGTAGIIGYVTTYLIMTTYFGYVAHDIRMFWQKLLAAGKDNPEEGYQYLYKELTLGSEVIQKGLNLIEKEPKTGIKAETQEKLMEAYKAMRRGTLDTSGVSKELIERFEMLEKSCPEGVWEQLEHALQGKSDPYHRENNAAVVLSYLFKEMDRRHSIIGRSVGSSVINRVLNNGANPVLSVKKAIVAQANWKTAKHFWLYTALATACAFAAAAFLCSLIFTGGVPHLIVAIAILTAGTIMTGIDGYFLIEALKNKRPKSWENIAMWAFSIFYIGAGIAATLMSGGLLPLIILSTISALWLLLFISTQVVWAQPHKEKHRYDEDFRLGIPSASGL